MTRFRFRPNNTFRAPKAIIDHPGVEECLHGPSVGVDDYRYDVWLKEGWRFMRDYDEGTRGGHFNSVADFLYALPTNVGR